MAPKISDIYAIVVINDPLEPVMIVCNVSQDMRESNLLSSRFIKLMVVTIHFANLGFRHDVIFEDPVTHTSVIAKGTTGW